MKRKIGRLAVAFLSCALTGVYADTITWTNTAGGSFQTAANWNPTNRIPGGLDAAEFKQSSTSSYTVTLNDHVSVTNVSFPSGQFGLTLDLNGYSLTSASNGTVFLGSTGGSAIDLTVKSSNPGGEFNLSHEALAKPPVKLRLPACLAWCFAFLKRHRTPTWAR